MAWYQIDHSRLNATKKCPKCGRQIPVGNNDNCPFCLKNQINTQLEQQPIHKEKECPKCKTLNRLDAVICSSCGVNFIEFKQNDSLDMSVLYAAKKLKRSN